MKNKEEIYEYAKTIDKTDFSEILKCARRISKLKDNEKNNIKIAVTGTSVLQFFTMALKVMLFRKNISAQIYEGNYNGIQMDILNDESELYKFINRLLLSMRLNISLLTLSGAPCPEIKMACGSSISFLVLIK
jgi:hypothetical protein